MLLADIVGATCAGVVSTLIGHPLDTIKVHLQTNHQLKTAKNAAKSLLQSSGNGPLVFFRGIIPPMANAVLMNTVMFSVFHSVKETLPQNASGALTAGCVSGVATAFLSTPADFVKIQSQLRGTKIAETARRGTATLFRGHTANLMREGVFTMVYLGLYDWFGASNSLGTDTGLFKVAAVSSLTGGLAWVASYPFDTVKSVMQGSQSSVTLRGTIRELWMTGGLNAFYKGCGASTGRAVLVTSTRMIIYEIVKNLF